MNLEQQVEAILFFKNEPVSVGELSKTLGFSKNDIEGAISNLEKECENRGVVLVTNGSEVTLATHPDTSEMIEKLQKEEYSRDLGKAGAETLSIVLYKGPVTRREIDHIRGVNSTFILRTLLIRGLVERLDPKESRLGGERGYSYKPTLKLLEYLGIKSQKDLPEYETALKKIEKTVTEEQDG